MVFLRKKIALLLSITMMLTLILPGFSYAKEGKTFHKNTSNEQLLNQNNPTETDESTEEINNGENITEGAEPDNVVVWAIRVGYLLYKSYTKYVSRQEEYVRDAVEANYGFPDESSNRVIRSWYLPTAGKSVTLKFGTCSGSGMTHILARHVPEYYVERLLQSENSFFDPNTSINTIEGLISNAITNNESKIARYGFTSTGTVVYGVDSQWRSIKLVIKNGTVITFYPDGWGQATDERNV